MKIWLNMISVFIVAFIASACKESCVVVSGGDGVSCRQNVVDIYGVEIPIKLINKRYYNKPIYTDSGTYSLICYLDTAFNRGVYSCDVQKGNEVIAEILVSP